MKPLWPCIYKKSSERVIVFFSMRDLLFLWNESTGWFAFFVNDHTGDDLTDNNFQIIFANIHICGDHCITVWMCYIRFQLQNKLVICLVTWMTCINNIPIIKCITWSFIWLGSCVILESWYLRWNGTCFDLFKGLLCIWHIVGIGELNPTVTLLRCKLLSHTLFWYKSELRCLTTEIN